MLLSPYLPLLFMGEEYGEENPFPFFCSFEGAELVEAVREGRKKEFAGFLSEEESIPDPAAVATFESAKLSWDWPEGSWREGLRRMYGDLLEARRGWPALRDWCHRSARLVADGEGGPVLELVRGPVVARWNLGDRPQAMKIEMRGDQAILFSSEWARYGGARAEGGHAKGLLPCECLVVGPMAWRSL